MPLPYLAPICAGFALHDVAAPQRAALGDFSCQFCALSSIVHKGRTQAVCKARWGSAASATLQEHRSRGCRALKLPFWLSGWLPLWPHARRKPKKLSTSINRQSRLNRPTPANTSDDPGRAASVAATLPARFLHAAKAAYPGADLFASGACCFYCALVKHDASWRFSCGPLPSLQFCSSRSPALAPRRPKLSKWPRSQSNRSKPANTNNPPVRAFTPICHRKAASC